MFAVVSAEQGQAVVARFGIARAAVLISQLSQCRPYQSGEGKRLKIKSWELISGKLLHSSCLPLNHNISQKLHMGALRCLCHLLSRDTLSSQTPLWCSFSLPLKKRTKPSIKPYFLSMFPNPIYSFKQKGLNTHCILYV